MRKILSPTLFSAHKLSSRYISSSKPKLQINIFFLLFIYNLHEITIIKKLLLVQYTYV